MSPLLAGLLLAGDIKTFTLLSLPYENEELEALGLWSTELQSQSALDARLKLSWRLHPSWRFEVHKAASLVNGQSFSLGNNGVASTAEEALPLSWFVDGSGGTQLRGRVDRLLLRGELGPAVLTVGRQPVGLGAGLFFTPLDLVSPFGPAAIDSEYKPGVDAVRVEVYGGERFEQTIVAAALGLDGLEDLVLLSSSRLTVGTTDLSLVLGEVRAEEVVGLSVSGGGGALGLHGDASLTLPEDEDPFVRAVAGFTAMPEPKGTLMGELYVQSLGTNDPAEMLALYTDPRWVRGELWAVGRAYAAVSYARELSPLVNASLAVISNVEDPSAMLAPGLRVSVSDEAELSAGAYVGLGRRPEGLALKSELGALPTTAFLRLGAWW